MKYLQEIDRTIKRKRGKESDEEWKKNCGICCVCMLITWSRMWLVCECRIDDCVWVLHRRLQLRFVCTYKTNEMVIPCIFAGAVVVFVDVFIVVVIRSPFKSVDGWLLVRQFLCTFPGIQDLYLRNSDARRCCFSFFCTHTVLCLPLHFSLTHSLIFCIVSLLPLYCYSLCVFSFGDSFYCIVFAYT